MRKPGVLYWVECFFGLAGLFTLAFCGLIYLETALYQRSETRQFEPAPVLEPEIPGESRPQPESERPLPAPIQAGSPISRIEIPRLGVSAVIVEGLKPRDLTLAIGHVPGTALPGEAGNVAIAGHRDTFFRKIGGIRKQDKITVTTRKGSFQYSVDSIVIVEPKNTGVLLPTTEPTLTLITCYPFYYVGPAPKRFVVRARQETGDALSR
jgi:sortase A